MCLAPISARTGNSREYTGLEYKATGDTLMLRKRTYTRLTLGMAVGILVCAALVIYQDRFTTQTYIVQGHDLTTLQAALDAVGGEVTHKLGIINALGVRLSKAELRALKKHNAVHRVYADSDVEITGKPAKDDGGSNGNNNIDSTLPGQDDRCGVAAPGGHHRRRGDHRGSGYRQLE